MVTRSFLVFIASAVLLTGLWSLCTDTGADGGVLLKSEAAIAVPSLSRADAVYEGPAEVRQSASTRQPVLLQSPALPQWGSSDQIPVQSADISLPATRGREPASMAEAEELIANASGPAEGSLSAAVKDFESSPQYVSIARPYDANVSLDEALRAVQSNSLSRIEPGNIFANPFSRTK